MSANPLVRTTMPGTADHLANDTRMRLRAFEHVRGLTEMHGQLTAELLSAGFDFEGTRIPLINPRRGIFKPRQMRFLLSIKTVVPGQGRRVWYDDQREAHQQIYQGDETVDYAFMGTDPNAADNRWLREAYENHIPVIYFLGVAPGRYQALVPTFIAGWDAASLKAPIAFGLPERDDLSPPPQAVERRYALRVVKQRLHQESFREAVITAYSGRCALSGLREHRLLDAAHIVSDKDELLGQPVVTNGLPLSKIHHAAFDADLLGIDPGYRVHVSGHLLAQTRRPGAGSPETAPRQYAALAEPDGGPPRIATVWRCASSASRQRPEKAAVHKSSYVLH